jgi:hypothetical protein
MKTKTFLFGQALIPAKGALGLSLSLALSMASCDQPMLDLPGDPLEQSQQARGPDYGFDHDGIIDNIGDIFKDGRQVPPAEGERLHSCGKLRYETFVRILDSRGVNVGNTDPNSVGGLLKRAQPVWGLANFPGRTPETTRNTTSSLVSMEDIAVAIGEELVQPTNAEVAWTAGACKGEKLFDDKSCNRDGFGCLLGMTPTDRQIDLCNNMVSDVSTGISDEITRKRLTVAAMVGVAYLCD